MQNPKPLELKIIAKLKKHNLLQFAIPLLNASNFLLGGRRGGTKILAPDKLLSQLRIELGSESTLPLSYFLDELNNNQYLRETWERESVRRGGLKDSSWEKRISRLKGNIVVYYALIRDIKPSVIVETGTASGSMTSILLAALHQNQKGKLISIDIPPEAGKLTMDITITAEDVGYYIPAEYKSKWEYLAGDAKILLPKVMASDRVDVFVHDSLHTRSHMLFEYSVARNLMPNHSLIISDDVLWNNSFYGFTRLNGLTAYSPLSNPNIGCFVNKFDAYELLVGTDVVKLNPK